MDASILVVGGENFLATVGVPIDDGSEFSVEVVANAAEAAPLIQAQQPDLLLIRANQPGSLDLCHQVKSQNQLAWIYCLVVDVQVADAIAPDPQGQPEQRSHHLIAEIEALDAGADAYLRLESKLDPSTFVDAALVQAQHKRLLSQIHAGLRQVQNHRELMRTNDILSAIALSDPLTELNNRRALEWELPRQIQNARNRNTPISVLMLDVDFFKHINDNYGHLVGDRALQLVSARLRHNLRFYDTPFRYGGEEFVIILSDTDSREARAIGARLCRLIADQPFAINDTLDLPITMSAGAATLRPEDDNRGISLLRRADQNLLKAKAQGRNRLVSSEESVLENS